MGKYLSALFILARFGAQSAVQGYFLYSKRKIHLQISDLDSLENRSPYNI